MVKKTCQDLQIFINEINILKELDHPNCLNIYEIWESDEVCSIVTEYLPGGDLLKYGNT